MKRCGAIAFAFLFALTLTSSAAADFNTDRIAQYFGTGDKPSIANANPKPSGSLARVGRSSSKVEPRGVARATNGWRCQTVRGVRTCTYYVNSRATRICVQKVGGTQRCRDLRVGNSVSVVTTRTPMGTGAWAPAHQATIQRQPATLRGHGYVNPLIPAVGRIWEQAADKTFQGICSGTLISRGIVITAAHCLYANGLMGGGGYTAGPLYFLPGQTWNANTGVQVPNYGEWKARDWWVTDGWARGQDGLDWGFIELLPNAQGQYPGDRTGAFQIQANLDWNNYEIHAYAAGYPASGIFAAFPFGNGQYFCDTTWGGHTMQHEANVMVSIPCPMTGGVSGGPLFVELSNGTWVIGGVANQAYPSKIEAQWLHSAYFDSRIIEFYNYLFG